MLQSNVKLPIRIGWEVDWTTFLQPRRRLCTTTLVAAFVVALFSPAVVERGHVRLSGLFSNLQPDALELRSGRCGGAVEEGKGSNFAA